MYTQNLGVYALILKINDVREDEKQVNINAGDSQDVSFSVVKDTPGFYRVFINGLSGSFIVGGKQ
jgi:hypothetical protein